MSVSSRRLRGTSLLFIKNSRDASISNGASYSRMIGCSAVLIQYPEREYRGSGKPALREYLGEKVTAGKPKLRCVCALNIAEGCQGWLGSIRRYANRSCLPLGSWLPPFGSTVTKTASICASVFELFDFSTQRFCEELSW